MQNHIAINNFVFICLCSISSIQSSSFDCFSKPGQDETLLCPSSMLFSSFSFSCVPGTKTRLILWKFAQRKVIRRNVVHQLTVLFGLLFLLVIPKSFHVKRLIFQRNSWSHECLSKIFERTIFAQMSNFFENFFSMQKFGLPKGYNTQHCLLSLLEKWRGGKY